MRFKIKTTIHFFVGVTVKGRKFIIHVEYFDANNMFSHPFSESQTYTKRISRPVNTNEESIQIIDF